MINFKNPDGFYKTKKQLKIEIRELEEDYEKFENTVIFLGDMNKKQRIRIAELENQLKRKMS